MPAKKPPVQSVAAKKERPRTLVKPEKPAAAAKKPQVNVHTDTLNALKEADSGYQLAKANLVKFLYSRRQAVFALARRFHLDAEDVQQEAYEVALVCLRDFNPVFTKTDGEEIVVQFNTFFGNRLEGKALEMRNRDPEYQARQAHLNEMSDADKAEFRNNPPLLVQHLDQETTMQDHLHGEVASAKRGSQTNIGLKIVTDSFMDKKLNELIAAERDDKRRAALLHVKVGGVASFDEIAFHFGVTDSRASQILNELMDAFYVQRLIDGDLKSVQYDFRKLKLGDKRALKLVVEAVASSTPQRQSMLHATFGAEYPAAFSSLPSPSATSTAPQVMAPAPAFSGQALAWTDPLSADENRAYPARGLEWFNTVQLKTLPVVFRGAESSAELPHIAHIMEREPDNWPLIVTPDGLVIDGVRRLRAAELRGKAKLLCVVRDVPTEAEAAVLRVSINMRPAGRSGRADDKPDKAEMYFAIAALADLGLAQQRIADALGTSRPNVIVYAKVKDKATAHIRSLFEDGYIQITNASACVELPEAAQNGLAAFIRKYGASWGKGPQFNEVFEAALHGKLDALAAKQPTKVGTFGEGALTEPSLQAARGGGSSGVVSEGGGAKVATSSADDARAAHAYRARISALETALKDAEVWASQRDAALTRQTNENIELKSKVEGLARELEAGQLMQHADAATLQVYLKDIKAFYGLVERLAGARESVEKVGKSLRGQPFSHKQLLELTGSLDAIAAAVTAAQTHLASGGKLARLGAEGRAGTQGLAKPPETPHT